MPKDITLAAALSQIWADARLIAAAPDLLDVLQEIVATIDFEHGTPETEDAERLLIATRAAIAKATGEA